MKPWLAPSIAGVSALGLFLSLVPAAGAAPQATTADSAASPSYDRASFFTELDRISHLLEAKPTKNEIAILRDSLPRAWTVVTPERTYSISSEPLRNQLTALSNEKALIWVHRLSAEVQTQAAPDSKGIAAQRAELDRILARSEFASVRPPSAWTLFKRRFYLWLARLLGRLFGGLVQYPITGQILFWCVIVVAVGCIALWLFRFVTRRDQVESLRPSVAPAVARSWQEWLRAAREAASRGDFREAVHRAYWAGITRLEDAGIVPKDRTRTPREYLRYVTEPQPGEFSSRVSYREPVAALTSRLEQVWYANRGARAEDFDESLRYLEALGCPLK